jgi:hypothetical protein
MTNQQRKRTGLVRATQDAVIGPEELLLLSLADALQSDGTCLTTLMPLQAK